MSSFVDRFFETFDDRSDVDHLYNDEDFGRAIMLDGLNTKERVMREMSGGCAARINKPFIIERATAINLPPLFDGEISEIHFDLCTEALGMFAKCDASEGRQVLRLYVVSKWDPEHIPSFKRIKVLFECSDGMIFGVNRYKDRFDAALDMSEEFSCVRGLRSGELLCDSWIHFFLAGRSVRSGCDAKEEVA